MKLDLPFKIADVDAVSVVTDDGKREVRVEIFPCQGEKHVIAKSFNVRTRAMVQTEGGRIAAAIKAQAGL